MKGRDTQPLTAPIMTKHVLIITTIIVAVIAIGATATYITLRQGGEKVRRQEGVATTTEEPLVQPEEPITTKPIDISDRKTYRNEKYGFEFKFPEEGSLRAQSKPISPNKAWVTVRFPFNNPASDDRFTIWTKMLDVRVDDIAREKCEFPKTGSKVLINGVTFFLKDFVDHAMGGETNYHEVYSTYRNDLCFKIALFLGTRSVRVTTLDATLERDSALKKLAQEGEIDLLRQVLSTFRFIR